MADDGALANFPGNSASFKYKQKITGSTGDDDTKAVKIMVPLQCLSNFWWSLETPLINCEISLILICSTNCIISNAAANHAAIYAITDTKIYVSVVTLSIGDNAKLLQQLKSGLKRTINWNKYETKTAIQKAPNKYFDFLIKPSFQGVNRLFVLTFNANDSRIGHSRYFLQTAIVEDYNAMINGWKFFINQIKQIQGHMKTFVKLQLDKEMIT